MFAKKTTFVARSVAVLTVVGFVMAGSSAFAGHGVSGGGKGMHSSSGMHSKSSPKMHGSVKMKSSSFKMASHKQFMKSQNWKHNWWNSWYPYASFYPYFGYGYGYGHGGYGSYGCGLSSCCGRGYPYSYGCSPCYRSCYPSYACAYSYPQVAGSWYPHPHSFGHSMMKSGMGSMHTGSHSKS